MMFRCKDISEYASAYVDRRMSPLDFIRFRLHLFICHNCRTYFAQFRALVASLSTRKHEPSERTVENTVEKLLRDRMSSK